MISENGKLLRDLISDYSEDSWSAAWFDRIEYKIWYEVNDMAQDVASPELERIVKLGKEFGIWVVWDFDMDPIDVFCVKEVPMEKWLEMYQSVLPDIRAGRFTARIFKIDLSGFYS